MGKRLDRQGVVVLFLGGAKCADPPSHLLSMYLGFCCGGKALRV